MPDDADADLRLTGSKINIIDPISKIRMTDPVRNAVCGHVYDKASLVAMLEKNKNTRYVFYIMSNIGICYYKRLCLHSQMSCGGLHQSGLYRFKSVSL